MTRYGWDVFLNALASPKTMSDIQRFMFSRFQDFRVKESNIAECYRVLKTITDYYRVLQSVTKCYRVLQSVTVYYWVLQSITEYYRVLQSITKTNLAHLLGPFLGLFLVNLVKPVLCCVSSSGSCYGWSDRPPCRFVLVMIWNHGDGDRRDLKLSSTWVW